MSRLTNDIEAINQAVSQNVVSLVASVLSWSDSDSDVVLNVWLALASLVVVPMMFWFADFVARYTRKDLGNCRNNSAISMALWKSRSVGKRVIKAFHRNETVIASFREYNQQVYQAGVYANTYALLLMPLQCAGISLRDCYILLY